MPDGVFGRDEIIASFSAVAEVLAADGVPQCVLVVVGGAYLALHGLRESTVDVDTATKLQESVRAAVEAVALQRGYRPDWLNDAAAPYAPRGLSVEICEVMYEHPRLLVVGPPADFVFLMKLYAARAPDYDDMVALWPRCGFSGAAEASKRFATAYPQAPTDPHMAEFIERIAEASRAG